MNNNIETKPTKHLKSDTFEKTKEAYYYAARKGKLNIDTFRSFTNLFGDEVDRTVFISTLYSSCKKDLDKEAIGAICRIKNWEFNDLAIEDEKKSPKKDEKKNKNKNGENEPITGLDK